MVKPIFFYGSESETSIPKNHIKIDVEDLGYLKQICSSSGLDRTLPIVVDMNTFPRKYQRKLIKILKNSLRRVYLYKKSMSGINKRFFKECRIERAGGYRNERMQRFNPLFEDGDILERLNKLNKLTPDELISFLIQTNHPSVLNSIESIDIMKHTISKQLTISTLIVSLPKLNTPPKAKYNKGNSFREEVKGKVAKFYGLSKRDVDLHIFKNYCKNDLNEIGLNQKEKEFLGIEEKRDLGKELRRFKNENRR